MNMNLTLLLARAYGCGLYMLFHKEWQPQSQNHYTGLSQHVLVIVEFRNGSTFNMFWSLWRLTCNGSTFIDDVKIGKSYADPHLRARHFASHPSSNGLAECELKRTVEAAVQSYIITPQTSVLSSIQALHCCRTQLSHVTVQQLSRVCLFACI